MIEGVQVRKLRVIPDDRGRLMEILRCDDEGFERFGQVYNVGAANEVTNRHITTSVLELLGAGEEMITYVTDRPGHDRRYSVTTDKVRALGWAPERGFTEALSETVAWYRGNPGWWKRLKERAAL